MSEKSRYLVTGATGFLGSHLAEALLAAGHQVVALCRGEVTASWKDKAGITVRRGDVLDGGSVGDAAAGCHGVFHCAGRVSRRLEDAEELYRIHVDGTKRTLDDCRAAGVRRAVVASTSGVVALSDKPEVLNESAPTPFDRIARFPYYRSKLYAEKAALDRSEQDEGGFEVVVVSPSLLLGPGDTHGSSTGDVVKFLERKVPIVPSGGLSFVDVRDAAAAMVVAMHAGRPGQRYLLSAANMTVDAFFGRLERLSGVAAPKIRLPFQGHAGLARAGAQLLERAARHLPIEASVDPISAEMAQLFWYVDATKAQEELGFQPRDPNDTLADTIADLYARGVVWPSRNP